MAGGSYLRFIIGLILALSVVISFFSGDRTTPVSAVLAIIFLILAALWAVFRF